MNILNLGCGSVRPGAPFINVDDLHNQLAPGTPERTNLDGEKNYRNIDLQTEGLAAFESESFDGVVASHLIEHMSCQEGASLMAQCRRVLKPGGVLVVSVPNAARFRALYAEDTPERAVELFGEPIHLPDGETTFFGYALWMHQHRVILDEITLWCYFMRAGFKDVDTRRLHPKNTHVPVGLPLAHIIPILNRLPFSLIVSATK